MPTDTHAAVGYPIAWCAVMSSETSEAKRTERRDLIGWFTLVTIGLLVTWLAVRGGARLGTASAPFLGRYRLEISPMSLVAPVVAVVVLGAAWRGWFDRAHWRLVSLGSGAGLFAW